MPGSLDDPGVFLRENLAWKWVIRSFNNRECLPRMSFRIRLSENCGRNSVVECQLPKLDVEGSNPFARSGRSTMLKFAVNLLAVWH